MFNIAGIASLITPDVFGFRLLWLCNNQSSETCRSQMLEILSIYMYAKYRLGQKERDVCQCGSGFLIDPKFYPDPKLYLE